MCFGICYTTEAVYAYVYSWSYSTRYRSVTRSNCCCPNSNGRKDGVKMGQQTSTLWRHFPKPHRWNEASMQSMLEKVRRWLCKRHLSTGLSRQRRYRHDNWEHNTFPQHIKELLTRYTHSGEIVVRLRLWCVIKITYSVRVVIKIRSFIICIVTAMFASKKFGLLASPDRETILHLPFPSR